MACSAPIEDTVMEGSYFLVWLESPPTGSVERTGRWAHM